VQKGWIGVFSVSMGRRVWSLEQARNNVPTSMCGTRKTREAQSGSHSRPVPMSLCSCSSRPSSGAPRVGLGGCQTRVPGRRVSSVLPFLCRTKAREKLPLSATLCHVRPVFSIHISFLRHGIGCTSGWCGQERTLMAQGSLVWHERRRSLTSTSEYRQDRFRESA
jgi:hypothetical protein